MTQSSLQWCRRVVALGVLAIVAAVAWRAAAPMPGVTPPIAVDPNGRDTAARVARVAAALLDEVIGDNLLLLTHWGEDTVARYEPDRNPRLKRLIDLAEQGFVPDLSDRDLTDLVFAFTVRSYDDRSQATSRLLAAAPPVLRAFAALSRHYSADDREDVHEWMLGPSRPRSERPLIPALLAAGWDAEAELLLDELATSGDTAAVDAYVAFHRARGTEAHARRVLDATDVPSRRRAALHLAAGRADLAVATARASGDAELLWSVLVAARDWHGALAVPFGPGRADVGHVARLALVARLAGDEDARARHDAALAQILPSGADPDQITQRFRVWVALGDTARAAAVSPGDPRKVRAARPHWHMARGEIDAALAQCPPSEDYYDHLDRLWRDERLGRTAEARLHAEAAVRSHFARPGAFEPALLTWVGWRLASYPEVLVPWLPRWIRGNFGQHTKATVVEFLRASRSAEALAWWEEIDPAVAAVEVERIWPRICDVLDGRVEAGVLLERCRAAAARGVAFDTLSGLCSTAARAGEVGPALELLEARLPPAASGSVAEWRALGELAGQHGRHEVAERAFGRALRERPWDADLAVARIWALIALGRREDALSAVRAIELAALGSERHHVAEVLACIGRTEAARTRFESILRDDALSPYGASDAALAWLREDAAGNPEALLRWVDLARAGQVRDIARDHWHVLPTTAVEIELALAEREGLLGRRDLALSHVDRALALAPRDPRAHALRVAVHPDPAAAAAGLAAEHAYYDLELVRFPASPMLHERFAWLCALTRTRLQDGVRSAERACRLPVEDDDNAREALAELRFQLGDVAGAIATLEDDRPAPVYRAGRRHRQLERFRTGTAASDPPR